MNQQIFEEYSQLKNKIQELEQQALILKEQVIEELKKESLDTLKLEYATFSISQLKTWKYTNVYQQLKKRLDLRKKEEEQKGLATFEVKESLIYRPYIKNDKTT